MDSGSLIALGAVSVLLIPAVLLLMDCRVSILPKDVNENQADIRAVTTAVSDNGNLYSNKSTEPASNNVVQENDTSGKTNPLDDDSESIKEEEEEAIMAMENNNKNETGWRCACEGGFLPPGLLQNFSGAEAVLRMSAGRCYHKKGV